MEMTVTHYYKLFYKTYNNILNALNISMENINHHSDLLPYLTERTLIIFKLDTILFTYKQKNDPHRLILNGRNALVSYLFSNKNISINSAKDINLSDALIILQEDIKALNAPDGFKKELANEFSFVDYNPKGFIFCYPGFQDSEWDPEMWDKFLLK
ncbi:hypothetical protein [Candidatus Sodalis sp. SoCistrobi]|uniref:ECs1072 family phage-associated protein n=1 Tax=Candidatus Sodalis sp. SoCistrobi TaxID=1922216 RepID=UPI0009405490|nr:hypothetical protein [Candidatus Sodalis sp. SoCistrobi]